MEYPALSRAVRYALQHDIDIHPIILRLVPDCAELYGKTYEFFLRNMQRLIRSVYEGNLGGEFVGIAQSLISGQLRRAYQEAWADEGTGGDMPAYLTESLALMVANQFDYVDGLYRAIVDARVDGTPLEPLESRATMWAGQYDTAYREAVRLIRLDGRGNLVWRKGSTERGCRTCDRLNGIVMSTKEWEQLGVHPRGYPNPMLECQGGGPANNCDCDLEPTEQRRSPNAFTTVLNIVNK